MRFNVVSGSCLPIQPLLHVVGLSGCGSCPSYFTHPLSIIPWKKLYEAQIDSCLLKQYLASSSTVAPDWDADLDMPMVPGQCRFVRDLLYEVACALENLVSQPECHGFDITGKLVYLIYFSSYIHWPSASMLLVFAAVSQHRIIMKERFKGRKSKELEKQQRFECTYTTNCVT